MKLGVNIDHIATLREARHSNVPEPALAALIAQSSGADSIVIHLREDRRHIKDADLYLIKKILRCRLNLEMSTNEEIVSIACKAKPDQATLVPEKRQELTTEGGLDVAGNLKHIKDVTKKLVSNGIEVSLFIDPDKKQIDAAKKIGIKIIEIHTGRLADAKNKIAQKKALSEIINAVKYAKKRKLTINAGHGLDYHNVTLVSSIKDIEELNIGYSIICRAVIVGLENAIKEMRALI